MHKIALINCFFGNFPWYFDFFLKSCDTNPTVDIMIFSDARYDGWVPHNVRIIDFTMADFNKLASDKLSIKIEVESAYKLCDFKPAYGVIFSDYLASYDFWGMCDLDIILGRVREFMTSQILEEYDVISTRHDFLTGWFMLFRNSKHINQLFMKSADYVKIFTSQTHYCFDECNFKHLELEDHKKSIFELHSEIESMEHVIQRELEKGSITVFYDLIMVDGHCGKIKWDKGVLSYNTNFEILLYHLIRYKANRYSMKPIWKDIPDIFYIDKYVFRNKTVFSFSGFFRYFYFNKIKLFLSKAKHLTAFYISVIKRKHFDALPTSGEYKNRQGQELIRVKENSVFFHPNAEETPLVRSSFMKDFYYIKKYKWLQIRYLRSDDTKSSQIQLIEIDGSISTYNLKNN